MEQFHIHGNINNILSQGEQPVGYVLYSLHVCVWACQIQ
jgi:hypothetical protein